MAALARRSSAASERSPRRVGAGDKKEDQAGQQGADVRAGQPMRAAEVPGDQRHAAGQQREQDESARREAVDEDECVRFALQVPAAERQQRATDEESEVAISMPRDVVLCPGISSRMPAANGMTT